jgi:hypothetical protein
LYMENANSLIYIKHKEKQCACNIYT